MKWRWIGVGLLAASVRWAAAGPISLPIYIEENHAGSFYWLAEHVDLDEEYTLIHFDAHTDASGIFDSDQIREGLRRVHSLEERRQLLDRWRGAGLIQSYNWIEPLMPAPISRVLWVRRGGRGDEGEARGQLDGHLEAAPRASGPLRDRYRAVEFGRLRAQLKEEQPVIVTIDLDYFTEVPAKHRAAEFERVWKFVTECRNLRAVTIAISRPYLKSEEQADDLLRLAFEKSLSLPTATIEFEPFETTGVDRSRRAREFVIRKEKLPAFRLEEASERLRSLLLASRERIGVRTKPESWNAQLDAWEKDTAPVRLTIKDHEPSTDRVWRVPVSEEAEVKLETDRAVDRIEWIALLPEYPRCNLTADDAERTTFAVGAPPRPRWREKKLPSTGPTLALGVPSKAIGAVGAIRVKARVEAGGHVRETPVIEVRRFAGSGFRAALTEQFGLPYLFGSGVLNAAGESGPETGFGADCANFVVYALRRQGYQVPWSNPKQLKRYLEPLAENVRPGQAPIDEEGINSGVIVHLGSHVAVIMEDRAPLGVLDANDRVAHQLEGSPEILSLGRLLASRKTDSFDLWRVPRVRDQIDLLLGGDVMLGRTIGAQIERGSDPLEGIRLLLDRAKTRLVNLECVLSDKRAPVGGKRYSLRAPLSAIDVLASARINAVSLANNHAVDFGVDALFDAVARLRAKDIHVVGAGETRDDAYSAQLFTSATGTRIGVIGLNDIDDDSAAVANTRDLERVAAALKEARARASFVLVFIHWGEENTARITEGQRELARWLIDHGADAIAGSHPHCVQPFDSYRGRPIFYSLGNLVFDGAPTVPNWNGGQLVTFDLGGVRPLFETVPVELDQRGFPQLAGHEPEKTLATTGAAFSRTRVQGASKNR